MYLKWNNEYQRSGENELELNRRPQFQIRVQLPQVTKKLQCFSSSAATMKSLRLNQCLVFWIFMVMCLNWSPSGYHHFSSARVKSSCIIKPTLKSKIWIWNQESGLLKRVMYSIITHPAHINTHYVCILSYFLIRVFMIICLFSCFFYQSHRPLYNCGTSF